MDHSDNSIANSNLSPISPSPGSCLINSSSLEIGSPTYKKHPVISPFVTSALERHKNAVKSATKPALITSDKSKFSPASPFHTLLSNKETTSKPTNLSIFRSPKTHINGNKNVYDDKSYCWKPSHVSKRREERFQTTNDLRCMDKIKSVLYSS